MKLRTLLATVLLCLVVSAANVARADSAWPTHSVRIVFGFPPASATDVIARAVGQKLAEKWGQPVIIDNRAGAGGNIGSENAAKSAPDGYTIFFCTVANPIGVALYSKLNYDYVKDFTPVTLVATTPLVLVANTALPVKNVKELIEYAKANPGKLNFGSGGVGTSNHLAGEMFKRATGTTLVHVPYKGTPAAYTDLLSGQISLMWDNIVAVQGQLKSGRLRALAVTSLERAPSLPDTPTMNESGLPGFEALSWIGASVPVGTPKPVIDKIYADLVAVLRMPEVKEQLALTGANVVGNTQEQFAEWNRSEIAKWGKAVRESGAKLD